MAKGKNKITIYRDWVDYFEPLTDEEAGKLIKHLLRYTDDQNPAGDRMTELLFLPLKKTLKRDLKEWEAVCERNRLNGMNGGRPKTKPNETQNNRTVNLETQNNPIIDIDIDNKIIDIIKEDSMLVKTASPYAKKIIPSLDEVIEYIVLEKLESQNEAEKFFDYYQANGWRVGKNSMKDWKAAARNWLKNASNYNKQTLKLNQNGTQFTKQQLEEQEFNRRYGTTFGQQTA
jgi:hypothetical protein